MHELGSDLRWHRQSHPSPWPDPPSGLSSCCRKSTTPPLIHPPNTNTTNTCTSSVQTNVLWAPIWYLWASSGLWISLANPQGGTNVLYVCNTPRWHKGELAHFSLSLPLSPLPLDCTLSLMQDKQGQVFLARIGISQLAYVKDVWNSCIAKNILNKHCAFYGIGKCTNNIWNPKCALILTQSNW